MQTWVSYLNKDGSAELRYDWSTAELPVGFVVITSFKEDAHEGRGQAGESGGRHVVGHDCFQIEMDDSRSRKGW